MYLILHKYTNTMFHRKSELKKIQRIMDDTKVIFLERNMNEFVPPNSNNRLTIMNVIRRISAYFESF